MQAMRNRLVQEVRCALQGYGLAFPYKRLSTLCIVLLFSTLHSKAQQTTVGFLTHANDAKVCVVTDSSNSYWADYDGSFHARECDNYYHSANSILQVSILSNSTPDIVSGTYDS